MALLKERTKVHYGNVSEGRSLDMSLAYAAGGDMDGDVMSIINPAGRDRMFKFGVHLKKPGSSWTRLEL